MVWADTRLGEFGPTNQKIGFARQQAVPQPELFLSPPAGPAGQQVTLQGFGFQPELNVFVQLGDSTISHAAHRPRRRASRLACSCPSRARAARTLSVFDESGNGASTSYFTEFGFGNIRDSIEDLTERLDDLGTAPAPEESAQPRSRRRPRSRRSAESPSPPWRRRRPTSRRAGGVAADA